MKRILKAGGILLLLTVAMTACGRAAPQPDEAAVIYDAGPFSSTSFQECVEPNHSALYGPFDQAYSYPAGQRTYAFSGGQHDESAPLRLVSNDNQEMTATGVLTFSLNTDCKVLQSFHEKIGLKYRAYDNEGGTTEGWQQLLDIYVGQPLQRAVQLAGQKYTWQNLYSDPVTRDSFEKDIAADLPQFVTGATADQTFFRDFKITVNKPTPTNGGLIDQLNQQQVQASRLATIQAQKAAQDAEIAQIQQLVQTLGPDGYILYRNQLNCEQNKASCVPFLPVPSGTALAVPAPVK